MRLPSHGWHVRSRSPSRRATQAMLRALASILLASNAAAAPARALPALEPALLGPDGLPGGRHVPSATLPAQQRAALTGGLGYGYTESVLGAGDHHQRAELELGASASVAPWLQLGARWAGRYDRQRGGEDGLASELSLRSRHRVLAEGPVSLALGAQLDLPPGSSAGRSWQGLSPGAVFVGSLLLGAGELSAVVGYRADRSSDAIAGVRALSPADRLASGAMHAAVVPLGLSYGRSAGRLRGLVEWSWDLVAGTVYAPTAGPMRVRLAAQALIGGRLLPGVELGFRPSSVPALDTLLRVEPRLWARLTLAILFERAPAPRHTRTAQQGPAHSELQGTVSAEGGSQVIATVEVLELNETLHTDAGGSFRLEVPPGSYTLRVSARGFESVVRRAEVDSAGVTILVVELARAP